MEEINIFFLPGTFGSLIEILLRNYTKEYYKGSLYTMLNNGSMHSLSRKYHITNHNDYRLLKNNKYDISTPVYPGIGNIEISSAIEEYKKNNINGKTIFIYVDDITSALQAFYLWAKKIYHDPTQPLFPLNKHTHINWNYTYQSINDMQPWELRECYSFILKKKLINDTNAIHFADPNWICINFREILNNIERVFLSITSKCNLTITNFDHFQKFKLDWYKKQQSIISELNKLIGFVNSTIFNSPNFLGHADILDSSIIQYLLLEKDYELKCCSLNEFPTSSQELHKYLIKL